MFLRDLVLQESGYELNEEPFEEQTRRDLEVLLVWICMALEKGLEDGLPFAEYDWLLTWHDGVVEALCYVSERFRDRVASGAYPEPKVGNKNGKDFYMAMATRIAESLEP